MEEENEFMEYNENPEAEQKCNSSGNWTSQTIINEQTADITATQIYDGSEKKMNLRTMMKKVTLTISLTKSMILLIRPLIMYIYLPIPPCL